jgi:hypothetical protein
MRRRRRLQPSALETASLSVVLGMVPDGMPRERFRGPRPPASEVGFPQSQNVGRANQHATVATLKINGCRGREIIQLQHYIVASLLIKASALSVYCLDWSILQPARKIPSPKPPVFLSADGRTIVPFSLSVVQRRETALLILRKCFTSPVPPTTCPKTHSKPV